MEEPEETLEDARREYEANEARRQAEAEAEAGECFILCPPRLATSLPPKLTPLLLSLLSIRLRQPNASPPSLHHHYRPPRLAPSTRTSTPIDQRTAPVAHLEPLGLPPSSAQQRTPPRPRVTPPTTAAEGRPRVEQRSSAVWWKTSSARNGRGIGRRKREAGACPIISSISRTFSPLLRLHHSSFQHLPPTPCRPKASNSSTSSRPRFGSPTSG